MGWTKDATGGSMRYFIVTIALVLASSCHAQVLDGVARRHASLFEGHAGTSGDRWYFSGKLIGRTVRVPSWVAALAVESRVVRCGRWSGWLSDRPLSVTGSSAVYRVVWSTGRWPR